MAHFIMTHSFQYTQASISSMTTYYEQRK